MDDEIVIRRLKEDDRGAVARLAQRDSRPAPSGELLGAESEGRLVAVISLMTGASVADPFTRTAEIQELLRLRVAHLRRRDPSLRHPGTPSVAATGTP